MSTQDQTLAITATPEELNALHDEIEQAKITLTEYGVTFVQKIAALGQKLIEKKAELGHGNWIPWVAGNLKYSITTVSYYQKIARNFQRVENLDGAQSLRQALALCDDSSKPDEASEEAETNPFQSKSKPTFVSKITESFFKKTRLRRADEWEEEEKKDLYYLFEELQKLISQLENGGTEKAANAEVVG